MTKVWNVLVLCLGLGGASGLWAATVAEVVGLRGDVWLVQAEAKTRLALGHGVQEGQRIHTEQGGRVKLKFVDGSVVVVSDASDFVVQSFELDAQGRRSYSAMRLDVGLISQTVSPGKTESWRVITPTVVTAVRGTQYLIEVRADKATDVSVRTGSVAVVPMDMSTMPAKKMRSLPHMDQLRPLLILDQSNQGTTCSAQGECQAAVIWREEKVQQMEERCSGV